MPTMRDGEVLRPGDKQYSVKNKSSAREMSKVEGENTTGAPSKNRGSMDIEAKATGNVRRARGGSQYDNYGVTRSRNNSERRADLNVGQKAQVASGKNKSVASDHPDVQISAGKTKVKTYPAGRNRGRNYRG